MNSPALSLLSPIQTGLKPRAVLFSSPATSRTPPVAYQQDFDSPSANRTRGRGPLLPPMKVPCQEVRHDNNP